MKKDLKLQCALWKEGKHYVAQCLNVDISSFGNTEKKALMNLKEALELYFEDEKPIISSVKHPEIANLSITV